MQMLQLFVFDINGFLKNSRIFSEKIKPFEFKANFVSSFGITDSKELFGQLFMVFPRVYFLRICYYPYPNKNFEIISEKMKFFEFLSNSLHFHVRSNSYLRFLFGSFCGVSKAKFFEFLRVLTKSISRKIGEISVKKNENFRLLVIFSKLLCQE